jgi:hypothetical protein
MSVPESFVLRYCCIVALVDFQVAETTLDAEEPQAKKEIEF